ncbi:MAG TPA: MBL fold metallo-hydrolase [Rhodopila sp.]|uniref:MBL fold metallo-hydrolase n=1 Tax=Rhodopila sp. TaxID=2480087 RepID=UPI002B6C63A5|nr:MBL fold metallo-hydrolase [Rhodopila sp.]HVY14600.1 MBL fold metallo-hydrolase [Rhodopila sp.]
MSVASRLTFPFDAPPPQGEAPLIAPGIRWLRLPLPYRLDHVNIYLLETGDGWTALDTGLGTDACRQAWDAALAGPLAGQPLKSLIVSHFHPDHVGLAGWLCQRFGLEMTMPRPEYLHSAMIQYAPADHGEAVFRPFYQRHGLSPEATEIVLSRGHEYLRRTTGVPPSYRRIKHGDRLPVGERTFQVLTGGGHSLEQAMLHLPDQRIFLAADQVIARISPNVSVHPMEPDLDALGIYLASLRAIRDAVGPDVLVLPGHGLPFHGLHDRIAELIDHHAARCDDIAKACRERPLTVAEIVPHVFNRPLDAHQTGFAFGEVLAHVNHMLGQEALRLETDSSGVDRYRAA